MRWGGGAQAGQQEGAHALISNAPAAQAWMRSKNAMGGRGGTRAVRCVYALYALCSTDSCRQQEGCLHYGCMQYSV